MSSQNSGIENVSQESQQPPAEIITSEQPTEAPTVPTATEGTTEQAQPSIPEPETKKIEEHDVPYYRNIMKTETDHLNELGDKWNAIYESTPNISEEGEHCWLILYILG